MCHHALTSQILGIDFRSNACEAHTILAVCYLSPVPFLSFELNPCEVSRGSRREKQVKRTDADLYSYAKLVKACL